MNHGGTILSQNNEHQIMILLHILSKKDTPHWHIYIVLSSLDKHILSFKKSTALKFIHFRCPLSEFDEFEDLRI